MKSSSIRLLIGFALILAVSLACTLPYTIAPTEPEQQIVYVEITSTPAEEAAAPAEAPAEPAQEPTIPINMDGEWTIWQGTSEQQLTIDFLQQDNTLIGNTATDDGHSLLFKGTISQDNTSVTGTWESTLGTSGSFVIYPGSGATSFTGNMGGGVPLCGVRGDGSKPSPCIK